MRDSNGNLYNDHFKNGITHKLYGTDDRKIQMIRSFLKENRYLSVNVDHIVIDYHCYENNAREFIDSINSPFDKYRNSRIMARRDKLFIDKCNRFGGLITRYVRHELLS